MTDEESVRQAVEKLGQRMSQAIRSALVIRPKPSPAAALGVPDRAELVWKEVVLELHPWARRGPTRGLFLGQGERGLSIRVEGGGRFVYSHAEVRSVKPA